MFMGDFEFRSINGAKHLIGPYGVHYASIHKTTRGKTFRVRLLEHVQHNLGRAYEKPVFKTEDEAIDWVKKEFELGSFQERFNVELFLHSVGRIETPTDDFQKLHDSLKDSDAKALLYIGFLYGLNACHQELVRPKKGKR